MSLTERKHEGSAPACMSHPTSAAGIAATPPSLLRVLLPAGFEAARGVQMRVQAALVTADEPRCEQHWSIDLGTTPGRDQQTRGEARRARRWLCLSSSQPTRLAMVAPPRSLSPATLHQHSPRHRRHPLQPCQLRRSSRPLRASLTPTSRSQPPAAASAAAAATRRGHVGKLARHAAQED